MDMEAEVFTLFKQYILVSRRIDGFVTLLTLMGEVQYATMWPYSLLLGYVIVLENTSGSTSTDPHIYHPNKNLTLKYNNATLLHFCFSNLLNYV